MNMRENMFTPGTGQSEGTGLCVLTDPTFRLSWPPNQTTNRLRRIALRDRDVPARASQPSRSSLPSLETATASINETTTVNDEGGRSKRENDCVSLLEISSPVLSQCLGTNFCDPQKCIRQSDSLFWMLSAKNKKQIYVYIYMSSRVYLRL